MKYRVIVETDPRDPPREHEITAALIFAQHLRRDVVFLRAGKDKTPDIKVNDVRWEIKSPTGNAKNTMENNLRTARKQSENIIIDLARSKMHATKAVSRIKFYLNTNAHRIKQVKIITKTKKIIDIT